LSVAVGGAAADFSREGTPMREIDINDIHWDPEDKPLNEHVVQVLVAAIQSGRPLKMPILAASEKEGYLTVVDGSAEVEAAKRCGAKTVVAYVIDGDETSPAAMNELRERVKARRRLDN
jgi:hypothetical protein